MLSARKGISTTADERSGVQVGASSGPGGAGGSASGDATGEVSAGEAVLGAEGVSLDDIAGNEEVVGNKVVLRDLKLRGDGWSTSKSLTSVTTGFTNRTDKEGELGSGKARVLSLRRLREECEGVMCGATRVGRAWGHSPSPQAAAGGGEGPGAVSEAGASEARAALARPVEGGSGRLTGANPVADSRSAFKWSKLKVMV